MSWISSNQSTSYNHHLFIRVVEYRQVTNSVFQLTIEIKLQIQYTCQTIIIQELLDYMELEITWFFGVC